MSSYTDTSRRYKNSNGSATRSVKKGGSHKTGLMYFKFIVLTFTCIIALAFMCYKIVEIKRDNGNEYERKAISQLINRNGNSESEIRPNRGAILDRNRETLAYSTIVYTVFIDVRKLVNRKEENVQYTIEKAAEILGIPEAELWTLLEKDVNGKLKYDTSYKVVAKQQPQSVSAALNSAKLYDVYTEEDTKRTYKYPVLAQQTIGFIRGDSSWGLESRYNKELSGTSGRVFRSYDTNGRSVVTERVEAEEGATVITTLDLTIQQAAERVAVKYGQAYNAEYVSAIVMNPNTGEILAMAAYPAFSLNDPVNPDYITNPKLAESWAYLDQKELIEKFYTIWKNFNITYTYEPGSTFKPVTVAAALEEGIITENDKYFCGGGKMVLGRYIKCNNHSGHGEVTVRQALAYSCNVAMMDIAEKMGRDIFYKYHKDFGYGQLTGIDIPGEESAAALQHTLAGLNAQELATASFGQRFNCTPLQAITGFCALINGGYLYKPYVVSQVVDQYNNVIYERKPEVTRQVISNETSDFLRSALIGTFEYGTAKGARISGYNIGGKSGTAQQGLENDPNYHEAASFIGYFPAEDPQYIVMTVIYRPEGKTPSASYMFQELVLDIISHKHIQPSNTNDNSGNSVVVDDYSVRSVSEAIQSLNRLGVDFELVGSSGSVVEGQYPNPGTRLQSSSTVYLMIKREDGDEVAEVPDVANMTVKEAKAALTGAGFIPVVSYLNKDVTYEDMNYVYEQMPGAYIMITPGSEVRILVRHD